MRSVNCERCEFSSSTTLRFRGRPSRAWRERRDLTSLTRLQASLRGSRSRPPRLVPELPSAFVAPLRERDPTVAVYVVAALEESALVRAAIDAGASGALLRPVLASQLARILGPHASSAEDASRPDSAK
jgi:hypothetical protein